MKVLVSIGKYKAKRKGVMYFLFGYGVNDGGATVDSFKVGGLVIYVSGCGIDDDACDC